ncbi:unnamed protein product [Phaeothamnion confervicola]
MDKLSFSPCTAAADDIIDEALFFFRANVMFRNFDVRCGADRILVYLTFYIQQCLREMEKTDEKQLAERALYNLAIRKFAVPGEPDWQLGTLFPSPQSRDEAEKCRSYLKQCREEVGGRLAARVFADGAKSKWWMLFSKRKFMGKELR